MTSWSRNQKFLKLYAPWIFSSGGTMYKGKQSFRFWDVLYLIAHSIWLVWLKGTLTILYAGTVLWTYFICKITFRKSIYSYVPDLVYRVQISILVVHINVHSKRPVTLLQWITLDIFAKWDTYNVYMIVQTFSIVQHLRGENDTKFL